MKSYSCLIVEDEPLLAEILQDYIKQIPFLELKGVCPDALYAMERLQSEKIDLMFLDIHLPKLKGTEFLKTLSHPPKVIITSAYADYALQGYELNVLDYLLKPVEFNRFLMSVNKLKQLGETNPPAQIVVNSDAEAPHLFFNVGKRKAKVILSDILYVESLREYIKITTKSSSLLTKFQLYEIEEMLTRNNFIRVHRSFIVAKDKIDTFSATDVEINGKQIPIGRSYKELVISILEK